MHLFLNLLITKNSCKNLLCPVAHQKKEPLFCKSYLKIDCARPKTDVLHILIWTHPIHLSSSIVGGFWTDCQYYQPNGVQSLH